MNYVSGLVYEYYHICHRKMWYVVNGISMESESENVQLGSLIDESSFSRERKHILIDEKACIDFMKDNTVFEVKKSSSEKGSAIAQIKYYLYVLKGKGVDACGELRIPKENYVEKVTLEEGDVSEIEANIERINEIVSSPKIPEHPTKPSICRACAFFELCGI